MNRFTTVLAIFAAVLLTDAHWGVMQSITWVKMVAVQGSDDSLSSRIAEVVSGQSPCDQCLALGNERNSQEEKTLELLTKSQALGLISVAKIDLSHSGIALFDLNSPFIAPAGNGPPGIDHPPRA